MRHTLTLASLAFGALLVVSVLGTQFGAEIYTNVACSLFDGEPAQLGGCGAGATNWAHAVRFGVLAGAFAAVLVVALWAGIRRIAVRRRGTPASTAEPV
jgi:hypothetical protein